MKGKTFLKLIATLLLAVAVLGMSVTAVAERAVPLFVDEVGVLTEAEAGAVSAELERIANTYSFDLVVYVVENLKGEYEESPQGMMEFADDYYDYNGFADNGCVLVYNTQLGRCHVSTLGYGITVFTDSGIQELGEKLVATGIYEGNEYAAFLQFVEISEAYINQANDGVPYDPAIQLTPEEERSVRIVMIIAGLLVSMLISLIVVSIMKAGHRSVRHAVEANEYIISDSVQLNYSVDTFLYSRVSSTKKNKDEEKHGGSSTHTSSSGRTHGGGGF